MYVPARTAADIKGKLTFLAKRDNSDEDEWSNETYSCAI
jgi:hypothetical protein